MCRRRSGRNCKQRSSAKAHRSRQRSYHTAMNSSDTSSAAIDRLQRNALICGVIGDDWYRRAGHCAIAQQFFRSYLFAFVFWVCVPLGSIAMLMLHHLTGGWWGLPIRRILEAGSRTIRLMARAVYSDLIGMSKLYIWAQRGRRCRPIKFFRTSTGG